MKPRRLLAIIVLCSLLRPAAGRGADGKLLLTVVDAKTKKPVACRMHLVGPGKRPKKIEGAPFWNDHFVFPGKITLDVPAGYYTFELERGPEYYNVTGNFTIERNADDSKLIELRRVVDMSGEGWWSGDLYLRRDVPRHGAYHAGRRPARRPGRHLVERQERSGRQDPHQTAQGVGW